MNTQILTQYSKPGPRYTSYPSAAAFRNVRETEYLSLLKDVNPAEPVSLYCHIPFCRNICYFCACSVIYTRNQERAQPYIVAMMKEIELVTQKIGFAPQVDQIHWGGGTPSFLSPEQITALMHQIYDRFDVRLSAEISIELDPRETSLKQIELLASLGFNRASLGVQDFDPNVQEAVNRIQPESLTQKVYDHARSCGFSSINFDLIYGLPRQTLATFAHTIDRVIALRPDRISIFNFAYVPWLKKHQLRIAADQLPGPETRIQILGYAVEKLQAAGYQHIGMDHFALPEDELSRALHDGNLRRNFQGYSTRGGTDLIGFGVTSIGEFKGGYAQNTKNLIEYYKRIDAGQLPVESGIMLSPDDKIRKDVIRQLISCMRLDFRAIEEKFNIVFADYFEEELRHLQQFELDGLIRIQQEGIQVTEEGRFTIRNICMVFDAYIVKEFAGQFSNTL